MKKLLLPLALCATLSACGTLEQYNRSASGFNEGADKAIMKPVATGYDKAAPSFIKVAVHNFFSNLNDIVVTINDLLQGEFRHATLDATRVAINSTFGLGGVIEVTKKIDKRNADFGQTLGKWGMPPGEYVVLPVLGSTTVRDGIGMAVDSLINPLGQVTPVAARNQLRIADGVHVRAAHLGQELILDEAALDKYEFVKNAYLARRAAMTGAPRRAPDDE